MTTLATTHHRLLANLAYDRELPSIINASVEFDEELMAPTYRLMMGVPGRSNALAIASRLGMDPTLLSEASTRLGKEKISVDTIVAQLQVIFIVQLSACFPGFTMPILTGEPQWLLRKSVTRILS